MNVEELEKRLVALETVVARVAAAFGGSSGASVQGEVASDSDLDGEHGNPVVRKDPKLWKGASFEGKKFSQCSPEYLESVASLCDWKAKKNDADPEKQKYAAYDRRDAARARGWARRIRAGYKPKGGAVADPFSDKGDAYEPDMGEMPF